MSEIRFTPSFTLPSCIVRRGATAFAACAVVCSAAAQEHGRLVGVEAGGDAAASSVELIGDRPLSFTTLKLNGPPRVVVDFAETEISGAPREVAVGDGTILRVATAAAGQKTARVVIELAGDADFDVRAHGNRVEVRVPRLSPLVAKAEPPASAGQPSAAAGPTPSAEEQSNPVPSGEPPKPSAPAVTAEAPPATPESEIEKRASLPTVALVGPRGAQPAPVVAPPVESAAARKRREREERIAAYAAAQRAAAEKVAAARKAAREKRLALAEQAQADKRAAAEKAVAVRKARVLAVERAAADKKARALAAAEKAAHSITGIGFRPVGDGQVVVHSNGPLEYGVTGEESAVLLHLEGAAIPLLNNRRPLDTRFFNGPVQRVVPVPVDGGTDLRIEVRGRPIYELAQSGTILTVTFSASR